MYYQTSYKGSLSVVVFIHDQAPYHPSGLVTLYFTSQSYLSILYLTQIRLCNICCLLQWLNNYNLVSFFYYVWIIVNYYHCTRFASSAVVIFFFQFGSSSVYVYVQGQVPRLYARIVVSLLLVLSHVRILVES